MSKFYKIIRNPRSGEKIKIEASTSQALLNKEKKQLILWEQQYREAEFSNFKSMKLVQAKEYEYMIIRFSEILKRNTSVDVNYLESYKEIDLYDYNPKFISKISKPDKKTVFLQHQVPWKNSFFEFFSKKLRERRIRLEAEAQAIFEQKLKEYEVTVSTERQEFNEEVHSFRVQIEEQNSVIRNRLFNFMHGDKSEVIMILTKVIDALDNIDTWAEKKCEEKSKFDYIPESGLVTTSKILPAIEDMPKYAALRWSDRKRGIEAVEWKKRDITKLHENVVFQLSLLSIKKIFDSFPPKVVNEVAFNGWLYLVNPSTGKDEQTTLVYIKVTRRDFVEIDFNRVEYRSCIVGLNGFISPSFSKYSNVKPLHITKKMNKNTSNSTRSTKDIISTKRNDIESDGHDYVKARRKKTRKKVDADFDLEFDD